MKPHLAAILPVLLCVHAAAAAPDVNLGPTTGVYAGFGVGPGMNTEGITSAVTNIAVGYTVPSSVSIQAGYEVRGSLQSCSRRSTCTDQDGYVDTFLDLPSSAIATFALVPHLGLGLGLEQASDGHSGEATDLAVRTTIGATWPLPGFPHVALTADYRFTALPDTPYPSGGSRPSYDHALLFGAKIYFGGKRSVDDPKMMPPVSIQEPSRYLVFFDWDVDSLTTRSSQIVATAAISSRHAVATIEIKAYDDDHSTTEYERELARRRVVAVSSELVRDGVAANAIVVLSKDNDDTGPGVRIKIIARTN